MITDILVKLTREAYETKNHNLEAVSETVLNRDFLGLKQKPKLPKPNIWNSHWKPTLSLLVIQQTIEKALIKFGITWWIINCNLIRSVIARFTSALSILAGTRAVMIASSYDLTRAVEVTIPRSVLVSRVFSNWMLFQSVLGISSDLNPDS